MSTGETHGVNGYSNLGCRCDICRDAWAAYYRDYRQRRMATTGERMLNGKFLPRARKQA